MTVQKLISSLKTSVNILLEYVPRTRGCQRSEAGKANKHTTQYIYTLIYIYICIYISIYIFFFLFVFFGGGGR